MAEEKMSVVQPQTMYSSLSDGELNAMYRQSSWSKLDAGERQALLQETVNREAIKDGNKFTAEVSFDVLPSNIDGYQEDGKIVLDYNKTVLDKQVAVIDGEMIRTEMKSPSYDALCTVLHEYQHVKQQAIIDGIIEADPSVKAALEANNNTFSVVDGKIASQYMTGETEYGLYYLQPCELDAYVTSEEKTNAIIESIKAEHGTEPAMEAYLDKMALQGHEAQLAEYRAQFNNPNVEKEIANVLQNTYDHTDIAVDPDVEAAVKSEMAASANAIFAENSCADSLKADTLSGDSISAETAQMAEGYLEAMTSSNTNTAVSAGEGMSYSAASADNGSGCKKRFHAPTCTVFRSHYAGGVTHFIKSA